MTFGPQRGHISCIFDNFFKDFGLLLLAAVIALVQGDVDVLLENLGVLVIVLLGPLMRIVSYLTTTYEIDEEKLFIRSGWLKKQALEVPISTITTVDFSQNIFHQIFGVYHLNIDNSSNIANSQTKVHMTLNKADAETVKSLLIKGRSGIDGLNFAAEESEVKKTEMQTADESVNHKYEVGGKELLIMGMLKSKMIFIFEVIGGLALLLSFVPVPEDEIFDGLADLVSLVGIGAVLALVFLGLLVLSIPCSMISTWVRYYGFKVLDNGQALKIEYGFINRKSYTIPKKKITGFYYEQSILMRLMKVGSLHLMAVGYGESDDESSSEEAILFPLMKEENIRGHIGEIIPQMRRQGSYTKAERKAMPYFFLRFSIFFSIGILIGCLFLPMVSTFFNGAWLVGTFFLLMALIGSVLNYKCTAIYGNEEHFSFIYGGFRKMTVFVKTNMIESIQSKGSRWKRKKGIADISVGCLASLGLSDQGVENLPANTFEQLKEYLIY